MQLDAAYRKKYRYIMRDSIGMQVDCDERFGYARCCAGVAYRSRTISDRNHVRRSV
jgi:hypothetical protein